MWCTPHDLHTTPSLQEESTGEDRTIELEENEMEDIMLRTQRVEQGLLKMITMEESMAIRDLQLGIATRDMLESMLKPDLHTWKTSRIA